MITRINTATHSYNVYTGRGLFDRIDELLPLAEGARAVIITDDNVAPLYLDKLSKITTDVITVAHGETSKSFSTAEKLLNALAELRLTRGDAIIALGGGVIGDLTGFVASVYMRGIKYFQIPTTLLAGIDSSVGGKTAVNINSGKNMVGRIYPPHAVVFDLDALDTLPSEVIKDGLGEGVKYAVLEGGELFDILEKGITRDDYESFCDKCILSKKRVVELDEGETGERRLLNLGHTLGHAIERKSNLSISHGNCVAMGMRLVAEACRREGKLAQNDYDKIIGLLDKYGFEKNPYPTGELIELTRTDKKSQGDKIKLVLINKIGDCTVEEASFAQLRRLFNGL